MFVRRFRSLVLAVTLTAASVCSLRAESPATANPAARPRLLVVVSVDQFPFLYQERLRRHLGDKGFFAAARHRGAFYVDCHHPHSNTRTGPGHSVLLTGASPGATGIIDNAWYDRANDQRLYCVQDDSVESVGVVGGKKMSPKNLAVGTLGDQMKLTSGGRAKVFGVGLKDRASILMAGHAADAAFWYDAKTDTNSGRWVSSSYYFPDKRLPGYLELYNNERVAAKRYGGRTWNLTFSDPAKYDSFYDDDAPWEQDVAVLGRTFPHPIPPGDHPKFPDVMPVSPFGGEMTLDIARLVVVEEKLGSDDVGDLLCINLSSNDFCGHAYGPYSLEAQDITYRTDALLDDFTKFLDERVGAGRWTLALSSDHGVAPIPEHAKQLLKIDAARVTDGQLDALRKRIEAALVRRFGMPAGGATYVLKGEREQWANSVHLNLALPQLDGENYRAAQRVVRDVLLTEETVAAAATREDLLGGATDQGLLTRMRLSFHPVRSGDVMFCLKPYFVEGGAAANHGSPWTYDTHVPLIFLGAGVTPGIYERRVAPAMIAPTAARILEIPVPAACAFAPLHEVLGTKAAMNE